MWIDYLFTSTENQARIALPANPYSNKVYYDQRLIIGAFRPNPICWQVSKVEDGHPIGINYITLKQVKFNQHTDYIDYENKEMWADYYSSPITPEDTSPKENEEETTPVIKQYGELSAGTEATIRNGYTRTLTLTTDDPDYEIIKDNLLWEFKLTPENESYAEESSYITRIELDEPNKLKIKLVKDLKLIGSVITVAVTDFNKINTRLELEVK